MRRLFDGGENPVARGGIKFVSVHAQEQTLSNGRNRRSRILLSQRRFHEGPRSVAHGAPHLQILPAITKTPRDFIKIVIIRQSYP